MGAIELLLITGISWIVIFLAFIAGFMVGRLTEKTIPASTNKPLRRVPVDAKPAKGPVVPGVDVSKERAQIVMRAKQEFGMNDAKAQKFAEDIISLGSSTLGRLHQKG